LWSIAALSVEDGLLVVIGLQGNTSSLIGGAEGTKTRPPASLDRLRIGSGKYRKYRIFALGYLRLPPGHPQFQRFFGKSYRLAFMRGILVAHVE